MGNLSTGESQLLLASLLSLCLGPFICHLARAHSRMLILLDGFIFVTMPGVLFLSILLPILIRGHWEAVFFFLAGILAPGLAKRFFPERPVRVDLTALVLGLLGLCLHSAADGAGRSAHDYGGESGWNLLPLAVFLHRFPVGLAIWWLFRSGYGSWKAAGALAALLFGTGLGFFSGPRALAAPYGQSADWFQALAVGFLLHATLQLTRSKIGDLVPAGSGMQRWSSGAGALLGVVLLTALFQVGQFPHAAAGERIVSTFFQLALKGAPALLIAYLVAGFMSSFLTRSSIAWMRRGRQWNQAMRGMAVGLPFPICSCGVVPLYRTLVRSGAPATAAMAFLISTPELGLDAVLLSIPLLGGEMTIVRVVAAALVALLVGWIVGRLVPRLGSHNESEERCGSPASLPLGQKIRQGLSNGFGDAVDHTAPWIVFGLILAAVVEAFLPASWLQRLPAALEIPAFAILGLPTYVCASSATPFVAVLLFKGVSPGAALAFLLTGPATNVTTFGVLAQLHGRRIALCFSVAIILLSVALGYLTNAILPQIQTTALEGPAAGAPANLELLCLILLAGLYTFSLLKRGVRGFVGEISLKGHHG
ncbi:MAG: permease [Candidatus Aminicenantes bacterium]|nr:permease [Candidatus Aminicenantes bacterium]